MKPFYPRVRSVVLLRYTHRTRANYHEQALAAEFPTAARVRPVFNNLANVYGLLHRSSGDENDESDGNGGKGKATRGGGKRDQVPFEGRLLVFRRGNGVEETKGRLLLKKLDYLQAGRCLQRLLSCLASDVW